MRPYAVILFLMGAVTLAQSEPVTTSSVLPDNRLPLPFGVGVNYYYQNQGYNLTSLKVNVLADDLAALENILIDNEVRETNLKLDVWVLPFLNCFGILGRVDGTTDVETDLIPGLSVDYDGVVYGGGITLAGGWDAWFLSLTAAMMETELDTSTSSVKVWIVEPRLGWAGRYGAVWVGGMFQQAEERHEGNITVPVFGMVDYKVEFEQKESWNGAVGIATGLNAHWLIDLEAGFGDRLHASLSATYRF
ncbi:MAG: hypothetical protein HQ523_08300 [Lentisphaerae bacterium]|nr:hypothetical protein [Lentisphaerota bacterium]